MVTKKKKIQKGGSGKWKRPPKPAQHGPKAAPVNVEASQKRANTIAENAARVKSEQNQRTDALLQPHGVKKMAALFEQKINKPSQVPAPEVKPTGPPTKPKPEKKTPAQTAPAVKVPIHNKNGSSPQVKESQPLTNTVHEVLEARKIAAVANPMYGRLPTDVTKAGEYITVGTSEEIALPDAGQRSIYEHVEPVIKPNTPTYTNIASTNPTYITAEPKNYIPQGSISKVVNQLAVANPMYGITTQNNNIYNILPPPRPTTNKPNLPPNEAPPTPNNAPPPVPPRQNLLPPKLEQPPPLPPKPGTPPPPVPPRRGSLPPKPGTPPPRPPPKPQNTDYYTNTQLRDAANTGMDYLKNLIQYAPQNNQADLQLMLKDFLRQQKNLKISISQTQTQQPQTQTPQQSAEQKKKIRGFFDKLWHNIKFISGDLKTESKELHHTTIERGAQQRALGKQLRAYRNSRKNTKKAMRNQRMSEMRSNLNSSNRPKTLRQTSTNGTQRQDINIGNY